MAVAVVMPALEMAQETGVLVRWLKEPGESVAKGEPVMEVETDKTTVEIESPGDGTLGGILAKEGDEVPVGRTIAWILAPGEQPPPEDAATPQVRARSGGADVAASPLRERGPGGNGQSSPGQQGGAAKGTGAWAVTPLARNIADEHGIDLAQITPKGSRIEKADVLEYLGRNRSAQKAPAATAPEQRGANGRIVPASPKARRMAGEQGIDLRSITGSGPEGAVLAADLSAAAARPASRPPGAAAQETYETLSTVWRVMAERMSESWTTVPHFYLTREVDAGLLLEWRRRAAPEVERLSEVKLTLTDLLVKCVGAALRNHPRVNAAWSDGALRLNREVNVGFAAALDEGLVVPVILDADRAPLSEIATRRSDLVSRARERRLRPEDTANGTFTLTNLGMYNVDAFNAIVNPPQAGILAVGRIADRVVPVDGRAEIRPMMMVTLSCDHRVIDGAQAARFLDEISATIEDPWRLLI